MTPLDNVGLVTAVVTMGGLTFRAIEAGERGFTAPAVLTAFSVAAVACAAFIARQRSARHPTLPLELFRRRNVTVSLIVGFAFVVGYYGLPFVMSLYLQQLRGLTALQTGLVFLPMMAIGAVLTPFSARIAERLGARHVVAAGLVLMAAGWTLLAVATSTTRIPQPAERCRRVRGGSAQS